jgi:hypothetical protein
MPTTTQKEGKKTGERVLVVPDPSLLLKLGATGYSLAEMLAEFIDNSIDARVENRVEVDCAVDEKRVLIEDNARGMSKEELVRALTVAHSTKRESLGEYGIGMKAAAVALGGSFTIRTKLEGMAEGYQVSWNAKEWMKRGEWSYEVETRHAPKNARGTSIEIHDLRFNPVKRVGILANELGRRFGPFIRAKELVLKVNGRRCKAPEHELLLSKELHVENPKDFSLVTESGKAITGWVGLLANSSQKGMYGFDTFRRGRLITWNDKDATGQHPTMARVVGEVHMDHVPVTTDKREWVKTDPLYDDAVATLRAFIGPWMAESRRLATSAHSLRPVELNKMNAYRQALMEAFQSPEMRDYSMPIGGEPAGARGPARLSEAPIEERAERSDKGGTHGVGEPTEGPETRRERIPQRLSPEKTRELRVRGKRFSYSHSFGNLGPTSPWSDWNWDDASRQLVVVSNLDNPVFQVSKDTALLAFVHIVDAVAMVVSREVGGGMDTFEDVRQRLLRLAAGHVANL